MPGNYAEATGQAPRPTSRSPYCHDPRKHPTPDQESFRARADRFSTFHETNKSHDPPRRPPPHRQPPGAPAYHRRTLPAGPHRRPHQHREAQGRSGRRSRILLPRGGRARAPAYPPKAVHGTHRRAKR